MYVYVRVQYTMVHAKRRSIIQSSACSGALSEGEEWDMLGAAPSDQNKSLPGWSKSNRQLAYVVEKCNVQIFLKPPFGLIIEWHSLEHGGEVR